MIPLVHDFTGETVLVFGGGTVGTRKARRFAREAHVVILSPTFADPPDAPVRDGVSGSGDGSTGRIDRVRAAPEPNTIGWWIDRVDPVLVVAATDDAALNAAIAEAASDRNCLVNRADRRGARDAGSVVVPATTRSGPVTVSISTDGKSPAVSRALRKRLTNRIEDAGAVVDLIAAVDAEIASESLDETDRRAVRRSLAGSDAVWNALVDGDGIPTTVVESAIADSLPDSLAGRIATTVSADDSRGGGPR